MSSSYDTSISPVDRPCPFITFYSFKGGVGRSMALINVAGILAARGFRVLVLDMDLEAPGISYLANEASTDSERTQPGLVDLLLDATERGPDGDLFALPPDQALRPYYEPYELPESFRRGLDASLYIMPAGRLDRGYAGRLERLDLPSLYREGHGYGVMLAFKQVVQKSKLFDYVFVDSRTGFSDESGICTRDLADYLIVLSGLNKQNIEGTTAFLKALRAANEGEHKVEVVLSPVPNGEDALVDERTEIARRVYSDAWGSPIACDLQIPYHPQLALTEEPHIFRRRRGYLYEAYAALERRTRDLTGDTPEDLRHAALGEFKAHRFEAARIRLERATRLTDERAFLDSFFSDLAAVDPIPTVASATTVYDYLIAHTSERARDRFATAIRVQAHALADKDQLSEAEAVFELALRLAPHNPVGLGHYAIFLNIKRRDRDAAEAMYKRAIELAPNDARNLGSYARFLQYDRKDLDAAEAMHKRAIEVDPNNARNLGAYASFLQHVRKDFDAAEAMYERAIEAAPNDVLNLSTYARFLQYQRKALDAAETMYKRAIEADSKDTRSLGTYARFLQHERKNPDAAEAMYKRAIETDPNDARNLGAYASFLQHERKNPDAAEAMYKRAITADPNDAQILGAYAHFLEHERENFDDAEVMYKCALQANPKYVRNLGNYAEFLQYGRKDPDAAEAMYKRAIEADPKHVRSLGTYARFLQYERKDLDAAEAMFKLAVEADPNNALNLGAYAILLQHELKDLDAAELMYKSAIEADPHDARILGNYIIFLRHERKDFDAAEAMYRRVIEVDPNNARHLGSYALFIQDERKDLDAAEAMYKRALEADSNNANNLGNYARLLLIRGQNKEGVRLAEHAVSLLDPDHPCPLDLECWMYLYCCAPPMRRVQSLARLHHLVTVEQITTGDWDFSEVIAQAMKLGHSDADSLPLLAEVLAGREPSEVLSGWPAWGSITAKQA